MTSFVHDTEIGRLQIALDDAGEALTELRIDADATGDAPAGLAAEAAGQVDAYLAGERLAFELPLAPAGTAFERSVWDALADIPYGERTSYGQLAEQLGRPAAARAVGRANATNPICIVVPCHRVVGSDGSLTGYAYGVDVKRRLLELESEVVRARAHA